MSCKLRSVVVFFTVKLTVFFSVRFSEQVTSADKYNILAFFRAKWRLLFINLLLIVKVIIIEVKVISQDLSS